MMNLSHMAESTGLSLAACRSHRIAYLQRHISERRDDAAWLANQGDELSSRLALDVYAEILPEARELKYLTRLQQGYRPPRNSITEQMIEQAREYPIEQVIEFDRQGKALAFCHADNHPSLSWHKNRNRCTCFVCGKSFNSIDVLVQRDHMTFPDAVRELAA